MPLEPVVELPTRIEPCFLEDARGELLDLLTELPAAATQLGVNRRGVEGPSTIHEINGVALLSAPYPHAGSQG